MSEAKLETGSIAIHTENILPIIKRWLYAEQDIFLRELVSNAADAIYKLEKIALMGEVKGQTPEPLIEVSVSKEQKTIRISDTGLGMTDEELRKYINQVAFSGVSDFVKKYEGKDATEQVIGHFGLGFYSSFMVSERVEIITRSYQEGATAWRWESSGDGKYSISPTEKETIGTTIVLHLNAESEDFLDVGRVRSVVEKYCGFMRYPIKVQDEQVNDTRPLWTLSASTLKDEDYQAFFQKLFPLNEKPLFWIHLNLDFPVKLRGVLYFPRLQHELEAAQGQIKLFCNQVYVEDNVKELTPEYLTLLKGVIDCPDLPLNVSRSALQRDQNVQKIAQHISKKVADKLAGMFNTEREQYESYWDDINPFIKYAMLRDRSFFDRMKDFVVFKVTNQKYLTTAEYLKEWGEKTEQKIIYVSDPRSQAGLVAMIQSQGIEAVIADRVLDQHFMPYLEMESQRAVQFRRIDADVSKHLVAEESASSLVDPSDNLTNAQKIEAVFKQVLGNDKLKIRVEGLKDKTIPAMLLVDENLRRLKDMQRFQERMSGGNGADLFAGMESQTLLVNLNNPAVQNLVRVSRALGREQEAKLLCEQIYDLAQMQHGPISAQAMQAFIARSSELLGRV